MIDGAGLVVAAAILALEYLREDAEIVSAGFLVFGIGQGLVVGSNAAGLEAGVPLFGGGAALWAAGLLLVSIPSVFPAWVRALGVVAAILFAMVAFRIAWGEAVLPTSRPLPFFAYPFLVLTFAGWIRVLLKE